MKLTDSKKEGVILINKPKGLTSHDVVDVVRKKLGTKKVGHSGTLDPLAEGLLIILVGRYTKAFPMFSGFDKKYMGILKLGETTSTGDSQGTILQTNSYENVTEPDIKKAFSAFEGETNQIPPMVSALRVNGKRLYKLARKGVTVKREPRKVTVHSWDVSKVDYPYVEFRVHCSKGMYVRKLAEDIGELLGCGAHMVKILRLAVGPFKLEEAINLDDVNESYLRQVTF